MPLQDISGPNQYWGICGFCGALAALYVHNQAMRLKIDDVIMNDQLRIRILAEIKTFLVLLKAKAKQELINEIIQINLKHYGADFNYNAYINKISGIVGAPPLNGDNFTLALMPDSLVYYLREMCDFRAARWLPGDVEGEAILGLSEQNSKMLVDRLAHWVYRDETGAIYSWKMKFPNIQSLLELVQKRKSWNWRVDVTVKPTR